MNLAASNIPASSRPSSEDPSAIDCASEIGSGALPRETIPSAGLAIRPAGTRGGGRALVELAACFRRLGTPVIGRIEEGALMFDLRCLEDEPGFVANLVGLKVGGISDALA